MTNISSNFRIWLIALYELSDYVQNGLIGIVDFFTEEEYRTYHKYAITITNKIPSTNTELFKVRLVGFDIDKDKPFSLTVDNCRMDGLNSFYTTFSENPKEPNSFTVDHRAIAKDRTIIITLPFRLRNFVEFKEFINDLETNDDFRIDNYSFSLGRITKSN